MQEKMAMKIKNNNNVMTFIYIQFILNLYLVIIINIINIVIYNIILL
jgi:hypothetical protein